MKIVMTGGGSAGHVTPNLALIPKLRKLGYDIEYIGTQNGIERTIIEKENIKYNVVSTGKLRRYFDVKNFTDPFRVIKGIYQSKKLLKEIKPNIVFSKGGFVSVPVVIGAYLNNIPVVSHESDITPGLANKICLPFCTKICVTFPETLKSIKKGKGIITGTPIRESLLKGSKIKGLRICGFNGEKPVLLIIGGSLGSKFINDLIRRNIDELLRHYDIIHICGKNNLDKRLENKKGYNQYEYVNKELPDFMNAADLVISRAGANVIFELLALKKPNILIPLSSRASRGDQILNAKSFQNRGLSIVIQEEELNDIVLLEKIKELEKDKFKYINNMKNCDFNNGTDKIIKVIKKYSI